MLYPHVLAEVVVKGWSIGLQISLKQGYFCLMLFSTTAIPGHFWDLFLFGDTFEQMMIFLPRKQERSCCFLILKRESPTPSWNKLALLGPNEAKVRPKIQTQTTQTKCRHSNTYLPNRLILFTLKIHPKLNIKWQWVVRHILSLSPEKDPNP